MVEHTRVVDQGIRGGDWCDEGMSRVMCVRVASDNPVRSTSFYGFRTFRPSRIPIKAG